MAFGFTPCVSTPAEYIWALPAVIEAKNPWAI